MSKVPPLPEVHIGFERRLISGYTKDTLHQVSSVFFTAFVVVTSGCAQGGSPHNDAGSGRDDAPEDIRPSDAQDAPNPDPDPDPDPNCANACPVVTTCLDGPTAFPPAGEDSWQCLDKAGGCKDGQCKIWCPHDNTVDGPQYTEACYLNDSERSMNYENACKSCCEGLGAVWDSAGHYCKPPP